jgi:hypothetical protein
VSEGGGELDEVCVSLGGGAAAGWGWGWGWGWGCGWLGSAVVSISTCVAGLGASSLAAGTVLGVVRATVVATVGVAFRRAAWRREAARPEWE